jgi:hypothetical protein
MATDYPKLTAEQMLELRSLQLQEANLTNSINRQTIQKAQVVQDFHIKVSEFMKQLKVDTQTVELAFEDLLFRTVAEANKK